jgi:uncharacterized SAM-binding protein YcdF (DUF218 family)
VIGLLAFLFRLAVFVCAILALGFLVFWVTLPTPIPAADVSAQAIVVVTGGSGRIATALALLEAHRAPQMFVSGVGPNVTLRDLLREAGDAKPAEALSCCVTLGHQATNTFENGTETAAWLKARNIHNIILVSSNYHLPRAGLELAMAAPDVTVTPFPTDTQTASHWWRQRWTAELMVGEYLKTLWVLGRFIPIEMNRLFPSLNLK